VYVYVPLPASLLLLPSLARYCTDWYSRSHLFSTINNTSTRDNERCSTHSANNQPKFHKSGELIFISLQDLANLVFFLMPFVSSLPPILVQYCTTTSTIQFEATSHKLTSYLHRYCCCLLYVHRIINNTTIPPCPLHHEPAINTLR